jgi:hypothetical protein
MGLGVASIHELTPEHLIIPDGFHRAPGATRSVGVHAASGQHATVGG